MAKKQKIFYVYIDKTLDRIENSEDRRDRVFYVGKGDNNRIIRNKKRNIVWERITNKYGQIREVILATKDENFALEQEKIFISFYGTFIQNKQSFGANLTLGGEGISGYKHNNDTIQKMIKNATGRKLSDVAKRKVSEFNKGKIVSEKTRKRMSEAQMGHVLSEGGKQKIGQANSKRIINNETRSKISIGSQNRPYGHASLTNEQVLEIRNKFILGKTRAELSKEYKITTSAIGKIINRRTWKHI